MNKALSICVILRHDPANLRGGLRKINAKSETFRNCSVIFSCSGVLNLADTHHRIAGTLYRERICSLKNLPYQARP